MEPETIQPDAMLEITEPEGQPPVKKTNKNLTVALIIGGIALFIILALVLVIIFTGNPGAKKGSAYDFVPNKPSTMVSFDLDMNMGDLVKTALPIISQQPSMQTPEAQEIIQNLPDLGFLQCSGFVLVDNAETNDSLIGIRLSGRANTKSSYDSFVKKISSIKNLKSEVSADGFATFHINTFDTFTTYLDESFMLVGNRPQTIQKFLSVKEGKQPSIRSHEKWSRIESKIANSPLCFFTIFKADDKEYALTGNIFSNKGEIGFQVSWLDGSEQVKGILPKDGSLKNVGDIIKWQKNLSGLISSTPDSTVKLALPFTFGQDSKVIEGESVGFVKLDQKLQPETIGLRLKGNKDELKLFLEKTIIGDDKTSKLLDDGTYQVTRNLEPVEAPPKLQTPATPPKKNEIPSTPPKKQVAPPIKTPQPTEIMPTPDIMDRGNIDTFYYKFDGDTLSISNKREGLKWVSGKTENVNGTILSAIVDGKLIISSLLEQFMSANSGGLPEMGANLFAIGSLIDKLNPMLHLDILGDKTDLIMKISIKFNQDFLMQ